MNPARIFTVLTIALLAISCNRTTTTTPYLTFSSESDTIDVLRENLSQDIYGTTAFRVYIESEPVISSGAIAVTVFDKNGSMVPPEYITASMVPGSGTFGSVRATGTVHASSNALPGTYSVKITGDNGKQNSEIYIPVRVR